MTTLPDHLLRACALACLALAALALTPERAEATTLKIAGVPELADRAERIVEGRVIRTEVVTYAVGPGVFTEYTVRVDATYKGAHSATVVVRVPGGKRADRHVLVEGMPALSAERTVVLMLEPLPTRAFPQDAAPAYLPLGLQQGVFTLAPNGATFHRDAIEANAIFDVPVCTGGEHTVDFEASALRAWLKARR